MITKTTKEVFWLCVASVMLIPRTSAQQYAQVTFPDNRVVPEDSPIGTLLVNITDSYPNDADRKVSDVKYSGSDHAFYTEQVPGESAWMVRLNTTLDYDRGQRDFRLSFQAISVTAHPQDIIFSLHVSDVNDNAPEFQNLPYNAAVDEDEKPGETINAQVHATDIDTGLGAKFTFELVSAGQDSGATGTSGMFSMNSSTGVLSLSAPLDYETRTFYHYTVIAKDKGTPSLNSTTDLFITVKDVQDSPPKFTNIPYVTSVDETAMMTSVLTVRAVDQDQAIPNVVTYNFTHSNCPGLFEINPSSGVISVANQLDRESDLLENDNGLCIISIQATEVNGIHRQEGNFTAAEKVTITVIDINDNPPTFSAASYTAAINENAPVNTPLQLNPQAIVSDSDQGTNSLITLSLLTGSETFELVSSEIQTSGSVQVRVKNNTQLDYETRQYLTIKIHANDSNPSNAVATATVTVTLLNLNEFAPVFTTSQGSTYEAAIEEGSGNGTSVITVRATDSDTGIYGNVTYSLSNDRGLFQIDAVTGEVTVSSNQTDREREDSYYLVVAATDGGQLQQTAPLSITISDRNDNRPVFQREQYDAVLEENITLFSSEVTVQATDADQADTANSNVTYAIRSVTPFSETGHFAVDTVTGRLHVTSPLDYDNITFPAGSAGLVTLVLVASDHGDPQLSADVTVSVTLTDINDNTPAFQRAPYAASIIEGSLVGSTVYQVNATDADGSAPNNAISFSIESGGQDRFRIDANSGTITVSGAIDREQTAHYTLVVVARDRAAAPKSSSSDVTITIRDVNDEKPSFASGIGSDVRVERNETYDGELVTMQAVDPDEDSQLHYSILYEQSTGQSASYQSLDASTIRTLVTIHPDTGIISTAVALNRTAVQTMDLLVQVNDTSGTLNTPQVDSAKLTITVLDINDHSPQFSPANTTTASIRENMGAGTALTFATPLSVTDLDEGENSLFEVHVEGENAQYFDVVPSRVLKSADLVIRVTNSSVLDYETLHYFSIELLARELSTPELRSSTVMVLLSLEDENDNSPEFLNMTYDATIEEGTPAGTTVVNISAIDADGSSEFNTVTYSLQGGNDLFSINSATGEVTVTSNATDYDTPPSTYQLTVLASDSGRLRNSVPLVVSLSDRNDLAPVFDQPTYTARLKEGDTKFEASLVVHALDGDKPDTPSSNVSYKIVYSFPILFLTNFFFINNYTGEISVIQSIDFEALLSPIITLTVAASDSGTPKHLKSEVNVTITVVDVNDETPTFREPTKAVSVLENATVGHPVHIFNATDNDGDSPNNDVYYLISSGANDQFVVNSSTGVLSVSRGLDRESIPSYSVVVLAIDKGVPPKTGTATLSITVGDVNDVAPRFERASLVIEVEENSRDVLCTMNATDSDASPDLHYSILWGLSSGVDPVQQALNEDRLQNLFTITSSTGAIGVKGTLDREVVQTVTLVVQVEDVNAATPGQNATGSVTLNVKDMDDSPPVFSVKAVTMQVDENAAQGIPIVLVQSGAQISVTDADQGDNSEFGVRVSEEFNSTVQVVPTTARGSTVIVLRVGGNNSLLDYETHTQLRFQIIAEGKLNAHFIDFCNVTINVTNVNDFTPAFPASLPYTAHINESSANNTSVINVHASDGDAGSFGEVTYSVLGDNALFRVGLLSGDVVTTSDPDRYDREKTSEYFLTVMATDGGGATTTTSVHVILDDINDNPPKFQRTEYSAFLQENSPTFTAAVKVQADDADEINTNNSLVTYGIASVPGIPFSNFTIDPTSGLITVSSPLNFEALPDGGVVRLVITATDRGSPPLSGSVNLTVTVQDENDNSPQFSQTSYSGNVTENLPSGTSVAQVQAHDEDGSSPNRDVFFLIASGSNDRFAINGSSGEVRTAVALDREGAANYTLTVLAIDRGSPPLTATTTLSVTVINVNDDPPRFTPSEITVGFMESTKGHEAITTLVATDNDEDADLLYTVNWTLSSGLDDAQINVNGGVLQNAFTINNSSGEVMTNLGGLDREILESATLIIVVEDKNASLGTQQTATGTVSIQVLDADDNPPVFSSNVFTASITENSPNGTPLQLNSTMAVTDIDKGVNSSFVLTLSPYSDCLAVVPAQARSEVTVLIRVTNASCFDYETTQNMDFWVTASGQGPENHTATAAVLLNIINIDDMRPNFTQRAYYQSIPENLDVNSSIIIVQATDLDKPPFDVLTYSLQGGDGIFAMNATTGQVTLARDALDYETRQQYQLTVEASDTGGLRDAVSLDISLQDVNDNSPVFVRPEYQGFVPENDISLDLTVQATDKDEGANKDIIYNISRTSELWANFTVNSATGGVGLRWQSGLDYESLPNVTSGLVHLVLVACDQGVSQRCSNVSVIVTVEDKNDNKPVFTPLGWQNISEDAGVGATLATVSASDGDGSSPNKNVFYVMASGGNDKFQVNSGSGVITRAGSLDSDTQPFYNLTINAIDGGSPANTATISVAVNVTDVNDVAPEFQPQTRIISVNESNEMNSSDAGRELTSFTAVDPDVNSALLYDVVWEKSQGFGPNQDRVGLDQLKDAVDIVSSTGSIRVCSSLDRESLSQAILVINVTDTNAVDGSLQTSTGTLTINVLDVNDHKPEFNVARYTLEVMENSAKDTVLTMDFPEQMNVSDSDTDQNCVFSVNVGGLGSDNFTAVPASARSFALVQLRVRQGAELDYEKTHSINFTVTATETDTSDHFSNTVVVTVNIIDINDNDPQFENTSYSFPVAENSPTSTIIASIQASDLDSGSFGNISYSLEGDAKRFQIDPSSGQLRPADDTLDRESKDTYLMTVVATDGGGRRSGATLQLTVTDVNDEVPRFPAADYRTSVPENSPTLPQPLVIQAIDDDKPNTKNSNLTYHLKDCGLFNCNTFSLDPINGVLTTIPKLDYEGMKNLTLVVEAIDQGDSPLTGNATIIIDVTDVNDLQPSFLRDVYFANITENSVEGVRVAEVDASDGDASRPNNVVFYVLDSGRGSDQFRVNSSSGVVSVGPGATLDREQDGGGFNLTLLVSDRGDPPLSSSATLSVSLLDVNDEPPVFITTRYDVSIYENASVNDEVATMGARDDDTDPGLRYAWLLDESQAATDRDVPVDISLVQDWFAVDPASGRVTVKSPLDRELAEVVVMKIFVNDTNAEENAPQTAQATLTVTLRDVNDNNPQIKGSDSLRVSESLAKGTEVASLTASDKDRDQTVSFSVLHQADDYFNISTDGTIYLNKQIDRERTPTVNFTVIATDSGSPPLSSNLTLEVTVLDANDNDPRFPNVSYVFYVSEDAEIDTVVAIINATDADQGANANVTFDFNDNVLDFVINSTTGAIAVKRTLDRETTRSYAFGVAALDNPVTDVKRRVIQQVTIIVNDINDNAPYFFITNGVSPYTGSYQAQIDETKIEGEKVLNLSPGPLQAADADEGENAQLSFLLTPLDAGATEEEEEDLQFLFRMDADNGDLFVNSSIRGKADVYNYTVTVLDHGQPSALNVSANLTIEVKDENINSPKFVDDYTDITIPECAKVDTSIIQFQAVDADRDKETNGRVTYFLETAGSSQRDLSYFKLDKDSGILYSTKPFNSENQSQYMISVKAEDMGVPTPFSTTLPGVTIAIDDGNDEPPTFPAEEYRFSVLEAAGPLAVGSVYAEDKDVYKQTCYTLTYPPELEGFFSIDTPSDKATSIGLMKPLDREQKDQASIILTVTATDCTPDRGNCDIPTFKPAITTVQVTVQDINDNPPVFNSHQLTVGVTSTASTGKVIVSLQDYVTDRDTEENSRHAFYSLGDYEMDATLRPSFPSSSSSSSSPAARPLALSVNGTVSTFADLPGDAEGFFTWNILVNDTAGNDTLTLKIYVVGEGKLLRITFFKSVEELRKTQAEILGDLKNQTGLDFIADDRVAFQNEDGVVDPSKSVLIVHAVNNKKEIMEANALRDYLDHAVSATTLLKKEYQLISIETFQAAASTEENKTKTEYILAAVICILVIAFLITLFLMLNNIQRFKRKLKAATIETYAMSGKQQPIAYPGQKKLQSNPIYGKEEALKETELDNDQTSQLSSNDDSLDRNSVDVVDLCARVWDEDEGGAEDEQEVVMDLYGEDDEDARPRQRMDKVYLQQALALHDQTKRRSQEQQAHENGGFTSDVTSASPKQHGMLGKQNFIIDDCESSDI